VSKWFVCSLRTSKALYSLKKKPLKLYSKDLQKYLVFSYFNIATSHKLVQQNGIKWNKVIELDWYESLDQNSR
jgi:hypothetical protein